MPLTKTTVAALVTLALCAGCSDTVGGGAKAESATDSHAPIVAPTDLQKLLLSDPEMGEAVRPRRQRSGVLLVTACDG